MKYDAGRCEFEPSVFIITWGGQKKKYKNKNRKGDEFLAAGTAVCTTKYVIQTHRGGILKSKKKKKERGKEKYMYCKGGSLPVNFYSPVLMYEVDASRPWI